MCMRTVRRCESTGWSSLASSKVAAVPIRACSVAGPAPNNQPATTTATATARRDRPCPGQSAPDQQSTGDGAVFPVATSYPRFI